MGQGGKGRSPILLGGLATTALGTKKTSPEGGRAQGMPAWRGHPPGSARAGQLDPVGPPLANVSQFIFVYTIPRSGGVSGDMEFAGRGCAVSAGHPPEETHAPACQEMDNAN